MYKYKSIYTHLFFISTINVVLHVILYRLEMWIGSALRYVNAGYIHFQCRYYSVLDAIAGEVR